MFKTDKGEMPYRRPTAFERQLSKIDEDEDGDDEDEIGQLSLPPIEEKKGEPDTRTTYVILPDNEDKPIEKKTPSIILPRISQSYTRRFIGYSSEKSFRAGTVFQRDERDEDLNLQTKEKQENER